MLALLAAVPESNAQDVWRGLHWDMSMDGAAQTLSRQGLKVSKHGPRKDPRVSLSAEADDWRATVYFDDSRRMNQITVIAKTPTKQDAAAAKEPLTKRFGAVKSTTSRTERRWGARIAANGPWTEFLVVRMPDEGWIAREEYGRGDASGPVGAFDLTWGQAAPDVEQLLRAAGFETHTSADANVTVHFKKGNDEGRADVDRKRGLVQIRFTTRVTSYEDGLAHVKPIEALRGSASEIDDATITTWSDATASVSLDVREQQPTGALRTIEIYWPPGQE